VLSHKDLIARIKQGSIIFLPQVPPNAVKQVSVDLRIGNLFTTFKVKPHIGSIRLTESLFADADLWDTEERNVYILKRGQFVLAQTHEEVCLPNDLMGLVEGRSSLARLGIGIHLTAPKIDPGFKGNITLEMSNNGNVDVELVAGESRICQLMFLSISTRLTDTEMYGGSPEDIFANQHTPMPVKNAYTRAVPRTKR
jgi:dCTP deaminase